MSLKRCVERRTIATIPQDWLDSINARIPPHLKMSPDSEKLMEELIQEVTDDFHNVMVKDIGIFSV